MYSPTGSSWSNPNVSFSYVPDSSSSTLFSKLDSAAPRDVWQREFARALQTWANVSNLNFREVADGGSGGDIRLAAGALGGYLAYAYFPGSGIGGDITLASEYTFAVGADYDLYSVALHEVGHSLGLNHTAGTVMNSYYQGILGGLTADDIAGIRSIYGARSEDAFDAGARNDSFAAASLLTLDSNGVKSLTADLTSLSDVDYFRVVAPASFDGTLRASVDARDISLLHGRVQVYDGSGTLLGSADAATYEGKAEVNLSGLAAGQTYYVVADGAVADAFGMGKYGLAVAFGGATAPPPEPPPPPPPAGTTADRYEVNDTLETARNLGRFNSRTETGLTLHTTTDTDAFTFVAKTGGTFRVTTNFASAGGQSEIRIYDSQKQLIATSSGTSVDVAMSSRRQYFVQIVSPSGTVDSYDLAIVKTGGTGIQPGDSQIEARGDGYFADAASAARAHIQEDARSSAVDAFLAATQAEHSFSQDLRDVLTTKLANSKLANAEIGIRLGSGAAAARSADLLPTSVAHSAIDRVFERLGAVPENRPSDAASSSTWDEEGLGELEILPA